MRYYVVFDVPDDEIVDPRLAAVNYTQVLESGGRVSKCAASTDVRVIEPLTSDVIDVVKHEIKEDDVILFRFPADQFVYEDIEAIRQGLLAEFPGHKVLGLAQDTDIFSASTQDAIDLLNKMIAHIKITSIV